jgi:hypothetical protein
MQTVQTYLTHQTEAIESRLTTILPGLIQGEVRTQCSQLAQEIGEKISSIWEEFNRHTGDQDDPMLPSVEGENRGSSRRGEWSRRNHHRSQQPNNGDEADEEDEGGENENEISGGTRKYKKQVQALRVSVHSCSP